MRTLGMLLVTALLAIGPSFIAVEAAAQSKTATAYDAAVTVTRDKVTALCSLAGVLNKAAAEPMPPKLSTAQIAEVKKYDAWLRTASEQLLKHAASWEQKVGQVKEACEKDSLCNRGTAAKAVAEMNTSFSLQYLQLQSQMQSENRAYTTISSLMRTKHDTVSNSISNVR